MTESFSEKLFRSMVDSPAYTLEGECHVSVGPDGKSTTDYTFHTYPNEEFDDDLLSSPADAAWMASQPFSREEPCREQAKKCDGKSCSCGKKPEAPKKPCAENKEAPVDTQAFRDLLKALNDTCEKSSGSEYIMPGFSFATYSIKGEDDEKGDSDSDDISAKPLNQEQLDSLIHDFLKGFPKNSK